MKMSKSLHIICAKCGSTDLKAESNREMMENGQDFYDIQDVFSITCGNCGEHTGQSDIVEQLTD